jgi:hypothetical protein
MPESQVERVREQIQTREARYESWNSNNKGKGKVVPALN